jgi:hypothetical protein
MPRAKKTKSKNQSEPASIVSAESSPQEELETSIAEKDDEQALQRAIEDSLKNPQTEVPINSLEAAVEFGSLLRELQHAYLKRVAFYRSKSGGSLSLEDARASAYHACKDEEEAKRELDKLRSYPLDIINFADMLSLMTVAPSMAEDFWLEMKVEALMEFESGHLASKALMPVHYMRSAWNAASYLGVRASLKDEWQPRGGIELSLIDMMAQAFLQYQHWVEESVKRSQTREREVHPDYEQWQRWKKPKEQAEGFLDGYWYRPFVSEQMAIEHAAQMADRWNRIYMRTLRNLRDLRRYSVPVTINNPQQVNIATDGGQQMNVAKTV